IYRGGRAADKAIDLSPERRSTEDALGAPEDDDGVAHVAKEAADAAVERCEDTHHAHRRRRVDGPARVLIVEGDVAARDRRAEGNACVGDAATGLPELEEHFGLLGIAEVEAIGDAERHGPAAGDVARGLG